MPRCTITARIIREHESALSPSYIFTELNSHAIGLAPHTDNSMDITIETSDLPYFPLSPDEIILIDNGFISAEARILEMVYHTPRPSVDFRPPTDFLDGERIELGLSAFAGREMRARAEDDFSSMLSADTSSASTCTVEQTERNFLTDSESRRFLNELRERDLGINPGFWENEFLKTAQQNNPAQEPLPFKAESQVDQQPQRRTHKKKRINKKYLKRYGRKSYFDNYQLYRGIELCNPLLDQTFTF